jgi:hypothetical protein
VVGKGGATLNGGKYGQNGVGGEEIGWRRAHIMERSWARRDALHKRILVRYVGRQHALAIFHRQRTRT